MFQVSVDDVDDVDDVDVEPCQNLDNKVKKGSIVDKILEKCMAYRWPFETLLTCVTYVSRSFDPRWKETERISSICKN